jgi:DeoR family fructose operon transcriptional repressor
MLIAQRRRHILDEVRGRGYATFKELAAAIGTSESTVRRDLRSLVAEGLVVLTRGGVGTPESLNHLSSSGPSAGEDGREPRYDGREPRYDGRESRYDGREPRYDGLDPIPGAGGHRRAPTNPPPMSPGLDVASDPVREAIAAHAAAMVDPGSAVLLGPGRTTYALARRLAHGPGLTVVTNSVPVALALLDAPQVEVIMVGGTLRRSIQAFVGPLTEQSLHGLRGAQVFLSGDGVTAERGLTTHNVFAAATDQSLVAAGRRVVVLADHAKVGAEAMCQTVPTESIDTLVTDAKADAAELARMAAAAVDVQLATA